MALDPRTGEILAMVSFPSYDPNLLADHDTDGRDRRASGSSTPTPSKPRLARSYQERFFPGSTFKVVTATAGILHGGVTADEPVVPGEQRVHCRPARPGRSATSAASSCGGALFQILRVSCNTAFAQMGVDIGARRR